MSSRVDVREQLSRLVDRARRGSGGALVVEGEAGMGKTTLLEEIGDAADGFLVVRLAGAETEVDIDHVALHQLATALRGHLHAVPPAQRSVLSGALGWDVADGAADLHLVGPATLSLLAAAADSCPLLVLVDDLQWLDEGSRSALTFAARRLDSDPIAVLCSTRSGRDDPELGGIERLVLGRLSDDEARRLLPAGTSTEVAERLLAATGGNPLALGETVRRLTESQLKGIAPLPDLIPIGRRLEAVFEPVIDGLSAEARFALWLLAAHRGSALAPILVALEPRCDDPPRVLDELEDSGLVERDLIDVRVAHPLVRSAVWARARPSDRRDVHRSLAEALPADQARDRAWHLAEASTAPDESLAAELEHFAVIDRERLGYAAAASSLERAARLSTDRRAGRDRMASAIELAALAGDAERARGLAGDLLDDELPDEAQGRAMAVLGRIEHASGSVPRASQLLRRAAERTSGRARVRVLAELAMAYHRLGDYPELFEAGRRLADAADRSDPEQRFLGCYFDGLIALVSGDHERSLAALDEAFAVYRGDPGVRDDPAHLVLATLSFGMIELTPERVRFLEERLDHARSVGALSVLVPVLALFAHGRAFMLGDHPGAYADAGEAVELGTALGIVADTAPAIEALAWQSAARGHHDQALALLADASALVDRAGTLEVAAHLALTEAFCALCRGDHDRVIAVLEPRLAIDGGRGGLGEQLGIAPLLVEAYVAVGRADEARALARDHRAWAWPDPAGRSLVERLCALTADRVDVATEHFERSLDAHAGSSDVFELARTELLFGSFLRKNRRRTDARVHLRRAHERFDAMGHLAWTDRCISELAASGESVRVRHHTGHELLTPQETRIALLVAQGRTNREVAAALYISPKTVESHLASIFRKRDVRSRTELAHAIASGRIEVRSDIPDG